MSVGIYIRVSTHEQNPELQYNALGKWIEAHGYGKNDLLWFEDRETGKHTRRPEFAKLQRAVATHMVDTVIVWKLDRLSRKLGDGIRVMTDWLERGVRIVSVTQDIDLSGTVGQLIAAVLFAVAQMENELRAERQAAGIAAAKARGVYKGRKPGSRKGSAARVRELAGRGLTAGEIASALKISERTVWRYLG